jgi:hypothetical protein
MRRPRWLRPALVLFFLSPAIGELLSGSSPPAEFFNPFGLVVLPFLYGSGAILARELVVRWKKGWASLLVLGAAYGIVEEGLMVKSFFDPNWVDLGTLGAYGRAAGVNWVWSLDLTVYHAVFSIAIPVLLTELLFPGERGRPWVGARGFRFLSLMLAADVAFGFLALTPYRPPALNVLSAAALAALLIGLAKHLPTARARPNAGLRAPSRPIAFLGVGLLTTIGFFLLAWAAPETAIPPAVLVALTAAYCGGVWLVVARIAGGGPLSDTRLLLLAAGALAFFILLAPLQELDTSRADDTRGMALVGGAAAVFLSWLYRKARGAPAGAPVLSIEQL